MDRSLKWFIKTRVKSVWLTIEIVMWMLGCWDSGTLRAIIGCQALRIKTSDIK